MDGMRNPTSEKRHAPHRDGWVRSPTVPVRHALSPQGCSSCLPLTDAFSLTHRPLPFGGANYWLGLLARPGTTACPCGSRLTRFGTQPPPTQYSNLRKTPLISKKGARYSHLRSSYKYNSYSSRTRRLHRTRTSTAIRRRSKRLCSLWRCIPPI